MRLVETNTPAAAGAARWSPGRLWNGFSSWLTSAPHATIGFSVLRIIFAVAMLLVLVPSFIDRRYLWGAGSWWVDPEVRRRGWWEGFRFLFPKDDPVLFDAAYIALLLLVALFLVGWKTRWVAPVLLLFWVGLATNSTLLSNGGDTLMRIVLFFALFADLSRHFSVDAWARRRREARGLAPRRPWLPRWVTATAHNTALILCCYQILLVYLVSSLLKLAGSEWIDGTALYYALSLEHFQVMPVLSELMWQSTPLIMMGTWLGLGVQLLFPLALLWKPSRYVAVALITFVHLGIAVLLGLWPFSLAMIALDLLLIRDSSWLHARRVLRNAGKTVRALREQLTAAPDPAGEERPAA